MTKAQHAPGPWVTDGMDVCQPIHGGLHVIASLPVRICCDEEVELANARLMAASPDLLEALEAVIRVADRSTIEFDLARAAIKKAKGEQS